MHHIAFLSSISKSGLTTQAGIGLIRIPAWNLPQPKTTAEPTFGCRLIIVSIVVREISVVMIQNAPLGSSILENIGIWREVRERLYLFTVRMHDLIIGSAEKEIIKE